MMNSRPRSSPARGRASSRYFVWIWYSVSGRSLYELHRSPTSSVNISSWVGASSRSLPRRSASRNRFGPYSTQRPVASYGSRGQQRREVDLLAAGGVHLLADDRLDLRQDTQPQRQPGVDPGGGAPDVSGAHQPLVARDLGVGRVLSQGPDEQGRHPQHAGESMRVRGTSPGPLSPRSQTEGLPYGASAASASSAGAAVGDVAVADQHLGRALGRHAADDADSRCRSSAI